MRIYSANFLDKAIQLAKKHQVLTIADEVMTGFYRTGTAFCYQSNSIKTRNHLLVKRIDWRCVAVGFNREYE
jgi:adenosylmethionine-8-amino-7-oxononanoate aminotransferase